MEDLKKDLGLSVLVFFLGCFILWFAAIIKVLNTFLIW